MNKRGIAPEFTTSLLILLLVFAIFFFIGNRILSARDCPAGYRVVNDVSDVQINAICGSQEKLIENNQRCCRMKSDDSEFCVWDKDEKEYVKCADISKFNFQNVCEDNTRCGISNSGCSGAFCEEGACFVENGIGKCVKEFKIDDRDFRVDENKFCIDGLKVDVLGSKCEKARHCIFDSLTNAGMCRGGFVGLELDEAKEMCKNLCREALRDFNPGKYFKSDFCKKDPFSVLPGGKNSAVEKTCSELLSRGECGVTCSTLNGAAPPAE